MNSPISQEMVDHHIGCANEPFIRELIGITAHVCADTFAHYGFSGVSSRLNRIINESIEVDEKDPEINNHLMEKLGGFLNKFDINLDNYRRKIVSRIAENTSGALGHGAVATFPDMPFLCWYFDYEVTGETSGRQNDVTFLAGCKALYELFRKFAKQKPEFTDPRGPIPFETIKHVIEEILCMVGTTDERCTAWCTAVEQNRLFQATEQTIPKHKESLWTEELKTYENASDSVELIESSAYKFFQAASLHRNYVLRELLPKNGLVVI